jgi:hypothetical protein
MTDTTVPARRQADGQHSLSNTTAMAYGLAGGGGVVLWGVGCLQAGHLIVPSNEVLMFLTASLAPVGHALGRVVLYQLGRWSGPANDNTGG